MTDCQSTIISDALMTDTTPRIYKKKYIFSWYFYILVKISFEAERDDSSKASVTQNVLKMLTYANHKSMLLNCVNVNLLCS